LLWLTPKKQVSAQGRALYTLPQGMWRLSATVDAGDPRFALSRAAAVDTASPGDFEATCDEVPAAFSNATPTRPLLPTPWLRYSELMRF
jgi:hypothetical protein